MQTLAVEFRAERGEEVLSRVSFLLDILKLEWQ